MLSMAWLAFLIETFGTRATVVSDLKLAGDPGGEHPVPQADESERRSSLDPPPEQGGGKQVGSPRRGGREAGWRGPASGHRPSGRP